MGFSKMPMGRARTIGSAAAMLVVAALIGKAAFGHAFGMDWSHLLLAVTLGLAGVGLTRPSLPVAVVARGAAWLVLAPTAVATALMVATRWHMPFHVAAIAACSAIALLLSRPVLQTTEARNAFAPLAFRSWLLGGSIATAAAGVGAGFIALQVVREDILGSVVLGALSFAFLASSIAVVRMRAWGVLLGAATSVGLLSCGLFTHGGRELPIFAIAAAPSLLMHVLPILIARFRRPPAAVAQNVALLPESTTAPLRVRIADPHSTHTAAVMDLETESCESVTLSTSRASA